MSECTICKGTLTEDNVVVEGGLNFVTMECSCRFHMQCITDHVKSSGETFCETEMVKCPKCCRTALDLGNPPIHVKSDEIAATPETYVESSAPFDPSAASSTASIATEPLAAANAAEEAATLLAPTQAALIAAGAPAAATVEAASDAPAAQPPSSPVAEPDAREYTCAARPAFPQGGLERPAFAGGEHEQQICTFCGTPGTKMRLISKKSRRTNAASAIPNLRNW